MSARCTDEQVYALEDIYDSLDLDGLQARIVDAVGDVWADDINAEVADLDCEIRTTLRDMRREVAGL